jgi:hypothetical protein
MNGWVNEYIEDHKNAWAETTQRSERYRLQAAVGNRRTVLDPARVWESLAGLKPYARTQAFSRASHFVSWLISKGYVQGPNRFEEFRTKNARLFKHVYERRIPEISFDEAQRLIERIEDRQVREKCRELLGGALRYVDSARRAGDFTVGKGGKRRRVYAPESHGHVSYFKLYRALKGVGLTPHMLRKIRLNQMAQKGMNVFQLCEYAGWSDPKTAMSYIQASSEEIKKFLD